MTRKAKKPKILDKDVALAYWYKALRERTNDAFFPLVFISTKENRTLMQAVMLFFGQYSTNWNLVFSALSLAAIPVIVVYIICSKYLIRGMMAGAVKG